MSAPASAMVTKESDDAAAWRDDLAACLGQAAALHGVPLDASHVASELALAPRATLYAVLPFVRGRGLRARLVTVDRSSASSLARGTLVETTAGTLMVVMHRGPRSLQLSDARGSVRAFSFEEVAGAFRRVGVAIGPADSYVPAPGERATLARFAARVLGERAAIGFILLLSTAIQLMGMAIPIATGVIVDRVLPIRDEHVLLVVLAAVLPLIGAYFVTSRARLVRVAALNSRIDQRLQVGFMHHLLSIPFAVVHRLSAGDIVARINSHNTIRERLSSTVVTGTLDAVVACLYLVVLSVSNLAIAGVTVVCAAAQALTAVRANTRLQRYWSDKHEAQRACAALEHEIVSGMESVRAGAFESAILHHWENRFVHLLNIQISKWHDEALIGATQAALRIVSPFAVIAVGAFLVIRGELTLGSMLALSAIAANFLLPLSNLIANVQGMQTLKPKVEKVRHLLEAPAESASARHQRHTLLTGSIDVEGLSCVIDGRRLLDDISFEIRPGELVAIVGRTGSGKSTLVRTLLGLYHVEGGRILYDGTDLSERDLGEVRRQIGVVTQQPAVFGLSIRENIALSDPALTIEEVKRAAGLANVHEDIEALPNGYDTVIGSGPGEALLSIGQRQRIALARALATSPRILMLDEATSAVDPTTEASIQRTLDGLNCTRIVVTHRLASVVHADRILVLAGGRLVESGRHDELLAAGGVYASLADAADGSTRRSVLNIRDAAM